MTIALNKFAWLTFVGLSFTTSLQAADTVASEDGAKVVQCSGEMATYDIFKQGVSPLGITHCRIRAHYEGDTVTQDARQCYFFSDGIRIWSGAVGHGGGSNLGKLDLGQDGHFTGRLLSDTVTCASVVR